MIKAKLKMVPVWIVQIVLALAFLKAGSSKLAPGSAWAEMFRRWGYPRHFYVAIGVIEVAGAVGLLIPRAAGVAASALIVVMAGALFTHLRHGERQAIVAGVFLALLALVAVVRRPRFLRRERKAVASHYGVGEG